jgi:hypothetical protein
MFGKNTMNLPPLLVDSKEYFENVTLTFLFDHPHMFVFDERPIFINLIYVEVPYYLLL